MVAAKAQGGTAARVQGGTSSDDVARIRQAYRQVFGRDATDTEIRVGTEFLAAEEAAEAASAKSALSRWEQYAQVLLCAQRIHVLD